MKTPMERPPTFQPFQSITCNTMRTPGVANFDQTGVVGVTFHSHIQMSASPVAPWLLWANWAWLCQSQSTPRTKVTPTHCPPFPHLTYKFVIELPLGTPKKDERIWHNSAHYVLLGIGQFLGFAAFRTRTYESCFRNYRQIFDRSIKDFL